MSKTVLAIKRSVVMLFSFALIATFLTLVNVGVNETGNTALSTATIAHADGPVINLTGGASSNAITTPTTACFGNCGPTKPQTSPPAGSAAFNPNIKGVFYGCSSVSAGGTCNISGAVGRDTFVREPYQSCELRYNNTPIVIGGPGAVAYFKARIGDWWNGGNSEERMFAGLTGYELGWGVYPVAWSDIGSRGYNGTKTAFGSGPYLWICVTKYRTTAAVYTAYNTACGLATDGRAFPYSVGYYVAYENYDFRTWPDGQKNRDWRPTAATCAYQAPGQEPAKMATTRDRCYYNLSHSGWYSTSRSAIQNGGTQTSSPPTYKGGAYPSQPYISGRNSSARLNNCTKNLSLDASLNLSNGYAYYRLQGNATYQDYQTYIWDPAYTRGARLTADIRPAGFGPISGRVYGTNVCRNNSPNTWQQYGAFGALPSGVDFSYSSCKRNVTWTCKIPNPPRINGVANSVEVMRDGTFIPVNLGGVVISGSGIRDISGASAVSDGNTSYKVNVVNGSSPFNGTNANTTKQYFELWKGDKSTETQWGSWISQPNAHKNSYLTYYWSSDNGSTWRMNYEAKINTAQFGVPWQATSDSGATVVYKVENNVDCDGVKTSNAATVLRSVTSEG